MLESFIYVIVFAISIIIPLIYFVRHRSKEKGARTRLLHAEKTGMTEPVSLHPKVDPNRCISTGACVRACPEGDILGLIDGKAELVSPTRCIGHGACAAACPVDAIELVFGTERRGVEIPHVKSTFETNVSGLYIAGELGGMGLIRNAMIQGKQAITHLSATLQQKGQTLYDVAIVGAGPAGLAATLQAHKLGLRYLTLDQDDIGGAILTYPRKKLVMTQPMEIPLFGKYKSREITKEELLELWQQIVQKSGVRINTFEKFENVQRANGHYLVESTKGTYAVQRLLLAIGRRGTPRKLGVPGEQSTKVAYELIEPGQFTDKQVLVVGGGDSAVEAALALAQQTRTKVVLSYRKGSFSRIKEKNQERIASAIEREKVCVLYHSNVLEIGSQHVTLDVDGKPVQLANDYVFILAGGELPTKSLQKLGIRIETKFGQR